MPSSLEIAKNAIDNFNKIQRYMVLAKDENAEKTYAALKEEYISLKAILNIAGVNLSRTNRNNQEARPSQDARRRGDFHQDGQDHRGCRS